MLLAIHCAPLHLIPSVISVDLELELLRWVRNLSDLVLVINKVAASKGPISILCCGRKVWK